MVYVIPEKYVSNDRSPNDIHNMQSLTEIYLASSALTHRLKHSVYLLENILKTKDF